MKLHAKRKLGQVYTLTLPQQEASNAHEDIVFPEAEVTIFHQGRVEGALDNALSLLETLYEYGVTNPRVLRLILTATGHRPSEALVHDLAAALVNESASELREKFSAPDGPQGG